MTTGIDVVNIARTQIGTAEISNNVVIYDQWYGITGAWCAMFVSWCFHEINASGLVAAQTPKGFSYCPAGLSWFQKNGQVVNKYQAQPGDLVFFSWDGNGVAEHVGIVEGASRDGLTTIEGNTTDGPNTPYAVRRWQRNYLHVMAIVRPAYPVQAKPATSLGQNKTIAAGVAGVTALGGGAIAVTQSTTPVVTKPPAFIAPAYPGTAGFKSGAKTTAVVAVERALIKVGLLRAGQDTEAYSDVARAAVIVYQNLHAKLLPADGTITASTYASLMTKAGMP